MVSEINVSGGIAGVAGGVIICFSLSRFGRQFFFHILETLF